MRRIAGLMALTLVAAMAPSTAMALPASTNGLVVSSAALEVQAVGDPTSWVSASTVYEGSPVRLVLGVESPGRGVLRTTVTLPGLADPVGDSSADVTQGAATVTVPLDLSYGAWLAGAVRNTADHLDVSVTYTATPVAAALPPTVAEPSPSPSSSEPTATAPEPAAVTPASMVVARPVRLVMAGADRADRRAITTALRALPADATIVATIRRSAAPSADCPTPRRIAEVVGTLARSAGRTIVIRRGDSVRQGCPRLELTASRTPRSRSISVAAATSFTVPITMAPRPVILVHGMWSSASTWNEYTRSGNLLSSVNPLWRGYAVSTMNTGSPFTPYAPVNTITQNANLAWLFILQRMSDLNAHEVDVVGHSMGGIITRRMLHDSTNGVAARAAIRSVVLLGTPNGGSSCSDAWAVPANAELTHSAMQTFNAAYPGYPGTVTTSLYSDHFGSTCFDANAGDLFVPSWSTQAQSVDVVRRISPGIQHANMTSDARLFGDYVKPVLALAAAPAPAGPTVALTNPAASSTLLHEGSATGATLSVSRAVTIESGQSLVASVVAADGATGTLTYPSGSGTASVPLNEVGDYPLVEAEVGYATLGGATGPITVNVSIDATTTATSPEWRWSLVARR